VARITEAPQSYESEFIFYFI